jgi:hypothetical protein
MADGLWLYVHLYAHLFSSLPLKPYSHPSLRAHLHHTCFLLSFLYNCINLLSHHLQVGNQGRIIQLTS